MSERNTIQEAIVVLQGKEDGKEIEYWDFNQWRSLRVIGEDVMPNFNLSKYRVKPEPLVMYVNVYSAQRYLYDSRDAAEHGAASGVIRTAVKMIEVVDDA